MTRDARRSVDDALDGIEAWQGSTNAFSQVFADQARAEADDPDRDGGSRACRSR